MGRPRVRPLGNAVPLQWWGKALPFEARSLAYKAGQVSFQGLKLSLWYSYGLADYQLGAGNISEDARGRWYLNGTVKVAVKAKPRDPAAVRSQAEGLDLGLKELLASSDGVLEEAQQVYRGVAVAVKTTACFGPAPACEATPRTPIAEGG